MKLTKVLTLLLLLDAAWVCVGLAHGWLMWPWIVAYWAILTAKNYVGWRRAK